MDTYRMASVLRSNRTIAPVPRVIILPRRLRYSIQDTRRTIRFAARRNALKEDHMIAYSAGRGACSWSTLLFTVAGLIGCVPQLHAQSMDELYEKAKTEKSVALVAAGPSEPY